MKNIILLYSTTDGHTIEICQNIKLIAAENNANVIIEPINKAHQIEFDKFDMIVLGASVRYGFHKKEVVKFIDSNLELLNSKPNALFSVNVVARKENKDTAETNPYFKKFLDKIKWKPNQTVVFAGKISYPEYNFFDKLMIQFIMKITKGPTDSSKTYEFTKWDKVKEFALSISK